MTTPARILIVGAGIGGLTLAHALRQRGLEAEIAEQAVDFQPVGAGIGLSINAMRVFDALGIGDRIREQARYVDRIEIGDAEGRRLRSLCPSAMTGLKNAGLWLFARADLQQAMVMDLPTRHFRMGSGLRHLTQTEHGVEVLFMDGKRSTYDYVVGADGVRSQVREAIFSNHAKPRFAGVTCWQFLLTNYDAGDVFCEQLGRGRRVGVVPLKGNRAYVFLTRSCRRGKVDSWGSNPWCVREDFVEFDGTARLALNRLPHVQNLLNRDFLEVRLPSWHSGNVVLIGDAAHAMTPNLGQGAAMAIEDAWVLADCLSGEPDHQSAFARYEAVRRNRIAFVQNRSGRVGRMLQAKNRWTTALRNRFVAWAPQWLHAPDFRRLYQQGPVVAN